VNGPGPRLRVVHPGDEPPAADSGPPPRLRTAWTADELMAEQFPPPRWAVPGLIAEGVNLLAGPPKVGKSWLSLGLALAVAGGDDALGSIPVLAGPVLYLALEDTPRRLQSRMGKLLDERRAPRGLTLATTCPPLPEGGAAAIAAWLTRNPAARMVVIDVFAKVRGRPPAGAVSAYDADYAAIGHAKKLADDYAVAVVLVHHVRKAGAEDFLEAVSGTNGLAGAADATLVLRRPRGEADGMLSVTGRDVDESEHALRFTAENGAWTLLDGPPDDYALSGTRAAIVRHVRTHPDSTPKAIAEATGINYANVRKTCLRMAEDGQLAANAAGRYRAAGTPETAPPESVTGVTVVTEPLPTCENGPNFEGHPDGRGVTAVTEHQPGPPEDPEDSHR
jgi:AAA domain